MRRIQKSLLLLSALLLLFSGSSFALDLGTNITIYDGMGVSYEDGEVEPSCVLGQQWDLEGFYINGTTLYMVGGYDFVNGEGGYTSGDIFFDTTGDAKYGAANTGSGSGYTTVVNDFGYDYVFDLNFSAMTYDVYSLSSASTVTVWYSQNDESNPLRYDSGGSLLYSNQSISYYTGLADADVAGLLGSNHNVVGVDIGVLPGDSFLAHYTYGCGNDNLIGSVPEPANMFLMGTGLLGLVAVGRKRYFR